jgi:hypothetical protein
LCGQASKVADPTTNSEPGLWASNGKSIETPQLRFVVTMLNNGAFPGEPGWPPRRKPVCRPSDSLTLIETSGARFLIFSATISFVSCRIRTGDKSQSPALKMATSSSFGILPAAAWKSTTPR